MLVHDEIELEILCLVFPSLSVLSIVLSLYYLLFQSEAVPKASFQNKVRERDVMLSFPSVADEDSTVPVRLENTKQLLDTKFQLVKEFGNT